MAVFDNIYANVKKGIGKISNKVESAADTASLHLKISAAEGKLNEYYEELGKLAYAKMRSNITQTGEERLEELLTLIDTKFVEQKEAQEELERRRAEKEAKKEQEQTEYEANAEDPTESAEHSASDTATAE